MLTTQLQKVNGKNAAKGKGQNIYWEGHSKSTHSENWDALME